METFDVRTSAFNEYVDITPEVRRIVGESGVAEGTATVYCPHTTGAITINENADPSVKRDVLTKLADLVPRHGDYHHAEGNSDAHIKSILTGASEQIPVSGGRLVLGTWQGIFFCEYDGPRSRRVHVTVTGE
ncbi:MAG: secondary thiamine-phosphate synthase enzyme YjbQ [Planctomycetota bacterium]